MRDIAEATGHLDTAVGPNDPGPDYPLPSDYSPDPFAPDPTIFPPAPDWLFPAVVVMTIIAAVVIIVLLYMWWKSVQMDKAERAAQPEKEWPDLSKLAKGGRWLDEADSPRKPKDDAGSEVAEDQQPGEGDQDGGNGDDADGTR